MEELLPGRTGLDKVSPESLASILDDGSTPREQAKGGGRPMSSSRARLKEKKGHRKLICDMGMDME